MKLAAALVIALLFAGALDYAVVDVGDVLDVGHVITTIAQPFGDYIEDGERTGVAQMDQVINRWSADEYVDGFVLARLEIFDLPGQGVV